MKKTILSFLLIFTILFNTYSLKPSYADPVTIGVTSYEVYTYITLVLTYLGVEFKNAQERQRWIEDEYGTYTGNPDGGFYDIIDYQIRKAKADAKLGGGSNKPEPRQIAIPVPDSIIDNLYNKLKNLTKQEIPSDYGSVLNDFWIRNPSATNLIIHRYTATWESNKPVITTFYYLLPSLDSKWVHTTDTYGQPSIYALDSLGNQNYHYYTTYDNNSYDTSGNRIGNSSLYQNSTSSTFYETNPDTDISITLPTGNFNLNWTSPYTGMQTVTMPLTTTGIESPVEVPVIPGEYVEPAPDEVTNPITQPVTDPLINPETGLPFIGPDGLPIFPSVPLVPTTPVTPIPAPETLTQPKDYTPNLTEISNGIKQLPERIINPIKKLFIPDTVSKIDFSPLNVPITKKFPFCIPWDLRDAVVAFSAPPVPPVFTFSLTFFGDDYPIVWDFAIFDEFAEITRFFVLIGFVVGLILATRGLIKG